MTFNNKLVIAGDVKISKTVIGLVVDGTITEDEVLMKLQEYMLKYGVIKIDVCLDPFSLDELRSAKQ